MKIERPIIEAMATILAAEAEHDDGHEPDLEELVLQARIEADASTEIEKYGRWIWEFAKDLERVGGLR